jgi:hypothetical protein
MEHLTRLSAPWTDSRPHPRSVNQLAGLDSKVTINSDGFRIVQRATAQSKTGFFRGYGRTEVLLV